MTDETELQRQYFTAGAADYDAAHSAPDEHDVARAWLESLVQQHRFESLLEVGAGTGRDLAQLEACTSLRVLGVEPVAALREAGYASGVAPEVLVDGDGYDLQFAADEFDVVAAFAVLHHVREPQRVVGEMLRVARRGIFISDSNNYGHGRRAVRHLKAALRRAHLWRAAVWLQRGGTLAASSSGDGISYSYSVYDSCGQIARKFERIHILNTTPLDGGLNPLHAASHVALFATSEPAPDHRNAAPAP